MKDNRGSMINDFIAYWAAARLLLNNGNPFLPADVLEMQRSAGWTGFMPLLMYNTPWTLSLLLPFGSLDHDTAQALWFLQNSVFIFLGAFLLWRLYSNTETLHHLAWVALLTFPPMYFVLLIGQIGPLVLVGLIGFLLATRKQAWFWAGTWLALASIKPHLLYLLWISALLFVLRERQWQLGAGFVSLFGVMVILPTLWDPQIYLSYINVMSDRRVILPIDWANPTVGMAVSALFGNRYGWLRWLPSIAGVFWLLRYWQKNCRTWDWSVQLPLVVLVSVVTTPYAWTFDYVILLPALMQGAVWCRIAGNRQRVHWISTVYLALGSISLLSKIIVRNDFWHFWFAPALLILYLLLHREYKGIGANSISVGA
jgi:hypothetical protein